MDFAIDSQLFGVWEQRFTTLDREMARMAKSQQTSPFPRWTSPGLPITTRHRRRPLPTHPHIHRTAHPSTPTLKTPTLKTITQGMEGMLNITQGTPHPHPSSPYHSRTPVSATPTRFYHPNSRIDVVKNRIQESIRRSISTTPAHPFLPPQFKNRRIDVDFNSLSTSNPSLQRLLTHSSLKSNALHSATQIIALHSATQIIALHSATQIIALHSATQIIALHSATQIIAL
ncbi:hypothetical protein BDZ97DRAFT_1916486 [Flammula alnicola]|nr:hypothetical protein BDZ97DRAFT_1916486 [Flammula alnicola]